VPNVGQALFPKTDLTRLSKNVNRFGTQMPKASIAMMRSRSNLDYNHSTKGIDKRHNSYGDNTNDKYNVL